MDIFWCSYQFRVFHKFKNLLQWLSMYILEMIRSNPFLLSDNIYFNRGFTFNGIEYLRCTF